MKHYRNLNLHCRTTPFKFCALLQLNIRASGLKIDIYGRFLNAYRIYAFMMSQLELGNLNFASPQRSECPVCVSNSDGKVFMAGDGNMSFQGKNKKKDGVDPLYKDIWVHPDLSAQVINEDKPYTKNCKDCSDFKADPEGMTGLRKDSGLHHKGLFGTICKHRIPGYFIFMTHGGEAYIYFFKMIEYYINKTSTNELNAKYDIGCNYKRYLKVPSSNFSVQRTD